MSVNSLRRDAARMRREQQRWENLWLRIWNLPEAWSKAANDVHVDYFLQAVADRTLLDIEKILELSKEDREIQKRKETYLGLDQECISCHDDYHQKTLANDCASCHSTDAFSPASSFNHDKTDFALLGKHQEVECIDCHQKET